MPTSPDLILIPKVETPEQVAVDALIIESRVHAGSTRPIWLMPILESALGIENAFAIAQASERDRRFDRSASRTTPPTWAW